MSGVKAVSASSTENQPKYTIRTYDDYGFITNNVTPGTVIAIVKENGDLYTWGDNVCYQLGKGYNEAKQDPYEPYYVMGNVVKAATNDHACAAVTENGDLYFWGYNLYGYSSGGVRYAEPTLILTGVKDVELGDYNVVALKNDGSVWMMGSTSKGAMARDYAAGTQIDEMTKVMDGCIDIAAGCEFAMALKSNGTLYGWGSNAFAALGVHRDKAEYLATPTVVATGVKSVDAGNYNAYFIKTNNSLWVTGNGRLGQRGQGGQLSYYNPETQTTEAYHYYPDQVDTNVRSVSGGSSHMLYLKNDGTMWGCGWDYNEARTMGRGDTWGSLTSSGSRSQFCWWPVQCGLSYGTYASQFGTFFSDVADGAYFYDPVEWAVDEGITSGTTATTFSPYQTCTRAQIITFLWRAAGSPEPKEASPFTDVTSGVYYEKAAAWAAEQGMADGTTFAPNDPCTRAMAVEFMWKQAGSPKAKTAAFTDVSSPAVNWAVSAGVTTGTTATTFSPDNTCTRGQIVTFLYRAFAD